MMNLAKPILKLAFVGLFAASTAVAVPPKKSAGTVFFENRIRPILIKRCYACHSEAEGKQKAGLLLDRAGGWLMGGNSGPAVVPHNLGKSLLAQAVLRGDEDTAMPPDKALSDEETKLLLRWIRIGAPGPKRDKRAPVARLGDQDYLNDQAKTHWSFLPIRKPETSGGGHSVDTFVRKRLAAAQLKPSPPADPRTQLRRLAYDLTGLPPTYDEVQAFVKDPSDQAWGRAVDRLLASPQFGERWGRYWLDIARYADTREWLAANADPRYPHAYTYRDYVIRAFNGDKPYDQFIREQIAADFYTDREDAPELAALGFLTVGSRYRNNRAELYNDRIDVVTRGVMGLTVSCARCHDHKYDPISIKDYYALYGVFASCTDPKDYPAIDGEQKPDPEDVLAYIKVHTEAQKALDDYRSGLARDAMSDFRKKPAAYMGALHDMVVTKKADVRKLITGKKFMETALTPLGRTLPRISKENAFKTNPVLRPWALFMNKPDPAFAKALIPFLAKDRQTHPAVLAALKREPAIANRKQFLVRYGELFAQALKPGADPALEPVRVVLNDAKGPFNITPVAAEGASRLLGKGRTTLSRYYNKINDVDAEHPGAPRRAMVLKEGRPFAPVVFERGDPQRRGEKVSRRFLSVFGGSDQAPFKEGSGRRELAEAIVDPSNPFAARVHMNRVWMHLIGEPLVRTPGDFGLQAEPPSHPELLDWLAATFMEDRWSTKQAIRRIVRSRTYRQSSRSTPEAERIDPENTLVSHANVRRLDFESMRDSMLAASAKLDRSVGGRAVDITVAPYSPRRTVYAFVDRVNLDDMFTIFDFPSPDVSSPERPETMVPQQALFSMNDPFTIGQAQAVVSAEAFRTIEGSATERIQWLYRRVYQRDATPHEIASGRTFLKTAIDGMDERPPEDWRYGYGSADSKVPAGERFKPLPYYDAKTKSYQVSKLFPHPKLGYAKLNRTGGHPGRDQDVSVIRRWTAPYDGRFALEGMLRHASKKGDGVRGQAVSSRHGLLGEWIAFGDEARTMAEPRAYKRGDTVDLITDGLTGTNSDTFRWTAVVRWVGESEYAPVGLKTVWMTESDFAAPPPKPMRPWTQLAHALLMTNEFLFLD